jgi:hypothetical protein
MRPGLREIPALIVSGIVDWCSDACLLMTYVPPEK